MARAASGQVIQKVQASERRTVYFHQDAAIPYFTEIILITGTLVLRYLPSARRAARCHEVFPHGAKSSQMRGPKAAGHRVGFIRLAHLPAEQPALDALPLPAKEPGVKV